MNRDSVPLLVMEEHQRFTHLPIGNGGVKRAAVNAQFVTICVDMLEDISGTSTAQHLRLAETGQSFSGFIPKRDDPVFIDIIHPIE
jgi:hypothetical protein